MRGLLNRARGQRVFLFWIAIAVFVLFLEIHFTGESASVSTETSKGLLRGILDFFRIGYTEATVREYNHIIRKCAHFIIYFAFGFSMTAALSCQRRLPKIPVALGVGAVFAVADEVRQFFVPGRGPGVKDVLIDFGGVLAGALAATAILRLVRRFRAERMSSAE